MKTPSRTGSSRRPPATSLAQLRALASTVRQDIVDTLQALGAASVPEIAMHMDRTPDSLYYHVRALVDSGLLRRLPEPRRRGRHQEWVYALAGSGEPLRLGYRPGRNRDAQALSELVANMLRVSQREFDTAIARPGCIVDGPRRELWAGRSKGWLSQSDLERCNALLAEVAGLLSSLRTDSRDRLFSLQFLLAPARNAGASAGVVPDASDDRPATATRKSNRSVP